jgi:DNA-binding NarL/FixJ family response regulator
MKSDLLRVVEAAYTLQPDPKQWLRGVADAARRSFDEGQGMFACSVDATSPAGIAFDSPVLLGCPQEIWSLAMEASTRLTPEEQEANLRKPVVFASVSERLGPGEAFRNHWMYAGYQRIGLSDFSLLTSMDINGHGIVLGSPRVKIEHTAPRTRRNWALVAAHLRAGARLVPLAGEGQAQWLEPEAVLQPDGRVLHATGDGTKDTAREALRAAAKAVDRARSLLRHRDPDEALMVWRGLVAGRWSLVDRFESDGRRLIIAVRNEPKPAPVMALSLLERQVVGYAALGHSNKVMAYELGLSQSAISQALLSAMLKLGVSTRSELAMLGHLKQRGSKDLGASDS